MRTNRSANPNCVDGGTRKVNRTLEAKARA
jgi:hypothetical protein